MVTVWQLPYHLPILIVAQTDSTRRSLIHPTCRHNNVCCKVTTQTWPACFSDSYMTRSLNLHTLTETAHRNRREKNRQISNGTGRLSVHSQDVSAGTGTHLIGSATPIAASLGDDSTGSDFLLFPASFSNSSCTSVLMCRVEAALAVTPCSPST